MKRRLETDQISIKVLGAFTVCDSAGARIHLSNIKAQAVVAMLATSENQYRRTRVWLQEKLWSKSPPEKAAASLRQALAQIRKAFGPSGHILDSNRHDVWLQSGMFYTDWSSDAPELAANFLDGLAVKDPAFIDWLNTIKGAQQNDQSAGCAAPMLNFDMQPWQVLVTETGSHSPFCRFIEEEFTATLQTGLTDYAIADLCKHEATADLANIFDVSVAASFIDDGVCSLRVSVLRRQGNRVLWSGSKTFPSDVRKVDGCLPFLHLVHLVQTAISREIAFASKLTTNVGSGSLLLSGAVQKVFSFDRDGLNQFDTLLGRVNDGPTYALALAWQTQIAVIQDIEGLTDKPEATIERGQGLSAKALSENPMNSLVLAASANASVFFDWDLTAASELAGLAVRANPANPLAWWSYANVALYHEKADNALQSAKIASKLAENSHLRFWCKFQLGLAALQIGDLELATKSLEESAAVAPNFRPPKRYLLAIYLHQNDVAKSLAAAERLTKLEPNFEIHRLIDDHDYPISLARKSGLVDPHFVRSIL